MMGHMGIDSRLPKEGHEKSPKHIERGHPGGYRSNGPTRAVLYAGSDYQPNANAYGVDTITYRVRDAYTVSPPATIRRMKPKAMQKASMITQRLSR